MNNIPEPPRSKTVLIALVVVLALLLISAILFPAKGHAQTPSKKSIEITFTMDDPSDHFSSGELVYIVSSDVISPLGEIILVTRELFESSQYPKWEKRSDGDFEWTKPVDEEFRELYFPVDLSDVYWSVPAPWMLNAASNGIIRRENVLLIPLVLNNN